MNEKIIKLCGILGEHLAILYKGDTFSALWPFTTNEAEFYIGEFFMKELYETIAKLEKEGVKKERIAKLFERPSKIAQYFTFFHSSKVLKKEERISLANDLIEFISYYRKDPFCEKKSNLLKKGMFDHKLLKISLSKNIVEIEKSIASLLLLYLELIYPTAMRLGHEFHGPYKKNKKYILIKEFFNLQPNYLKFKTKIPFSKIICVEETTEKPQLDFFNHLIKMPERKRAAIILNSKVLGEKEAEELLEKLKCSIYKINIEASKLSKNDFLNLLAKGYFYSIQNLKTELGEKVKLPKQLSNKIKNENYFLDTEKIKNWIQQKSLEELKEKITKSFLEIFENGKY